MSKERPIHQPTHKTIHPRIGGKSTQISNLQTEFKNLDLFKCYNVLTDLGGHPLGGGWVGLWGCGCMGCPMQAHMCMHACIHAHMHMHVKHDKHGCLHGGSLLQLLYMYILVLCMYIHTCACS